MRALQIAFLTLVIAGIASAYWGTVVAPEVSPGGAVSALGLVAGVLFVMRSRRK